MVDAGARVINFEDVASTFTPSFQIRPGGLGDLFEGRLLRGVVRFDIVENINDQAKPAEFGQRSLDPFVAENDGTPFKYDLGIGRSERTFFIANTVSITVGDYGLDEDKVVLQAFSSTDVLLGEATATLPAGGENFTSTTLTVTSKFGEQIGYIKFVGGSAQYPNSVFYDNITLTYTPTEFELTKSNPFWQSDINKVVDDIVKNLMAEALEGKGENFVYLIGGGKSGGRDPITPYQKQYRDEYTTRATEALKVGSKEWLDAVQTYLDEKYPRIGDVFKGYRESELTGLSFDIFISMFQTADLAVKIAEQTGLKAYDPRVLIAAGIQPFGDLADDIVLEVLPSPSLPGGVEPPPFTPNPVNDLIAENIKLGTYVVKKLAPSQPPSSEANPVAKLVNLPSVNFASVDNSLLQAITINGGEGTPEDDKLFGTANDDILQGNEGWDVLIGNAGNDLLFGGAGADVLNGNSTNFIAGEVDVLVGGEGVDVFVLGNPYRNYYDDQNSGTSGTSDYALISDFNPNQDFMVLKGKFNDYIFKPNEDGKGLIVFLDNDSIKGTSVNDELIATIDGVTSISPIDILFV